MKELIVAEAVTEDMVKKFFDQCKPKQGKLLKGEFEKLISLLSDNESGGASDNMTMTNTDNEINDNNNNNEEEEEDEEEDDDDDDDFEEVSVEEVFEELCNDKKMIPFDTLASWYYD